MKKYFMKGTEDEVVFGDMIEIDFVGEENGHTVHNHTEVKFLPELVDLLLDEDIIEVVETKKKDELIDFSEDTDIEEALQELYNNQEIFREKLSILKAEVQSILSIVEEIKKDIKPHKRATSKK